MIVEIDITGRGAAKGGKSAICKCDYCGKEFKRRFSYVGKSKNHFCNRTCKALWQKEYNGGKNNPLYSRVEVKCSNCGESLTRKRCFLKKYKHFFCSSKCRGEWKKKNLMPSNKEWWNGGTRENNGYIQIFSKGHPYKNKSNYVMEHRLVMEEHLGRYLKPEEVVHHINGNKKDNRLENLMLFKNQAEHTKFHASQRQLRRSYG